ncbi:MAG TPA: PEP-CTERM sorting domain-containing protein [Gemmatimonas sp.]|uniref:PEP-CTERM sorting domain-containing protein n=1 Tax=Gemmatimonas sp. TaxID=1962908 RepID=UPI002EDBB7D2
MKRAILSTLAAVASLAVTQTAQAQVNIVGTTTGCFYTTSNANCIGSSYGGLSFTGGSFNVSASQGGYYDLDDLNDYLGSFVLASNTNTNFGDPLRFRLTVSFSSPTSADPNPYISTADFDGDVLINSNGDDLDFDFNNSWSMIDYAGGSDTYFYIRTNDISNMGRGDTRLVTGNIACEDGWEDICKRDGSTPPVQAPEPASLALLAAGFAGLLGVKRRRQNG